MERIDALDFKFNSYLTVGRDQALQAAREAEEAIRRGSCLGPMHGIPVAVKDQFWTRGTRPYDVFPSPKQLEDTPGYGQLLEQSVG